MSEQKQDGQLEHTYSSYVRIRDVGPGDLPEAMNDREKWRERVRDIRAGGTLYFDNVSSWILSVRLVLISEEFKIWAVTDRQFKEEIWDDEVFSRFKLLGRYIFVAYLIREYNCYFRMK